MNENYLELIKQKRELNDRLETLNGKEFAATSNGEMNRINNERNDIYSALTIIDKKLNH